MPSAQLTHYTVNWPEPPHLKLLDATQESEACEIHFKDGARAKGEIVHFTGRDGSLKFKPAAGAQANSIVDLDFDKIKQIRLLRHVAIAIDDMMVNEPNESVFELSDVQVYSIEFDDGEILCGETVGFVKLPQGLFLYFNVGDHRVSRVFIPDLAIIYWQIGDPIGKMLIEENAVSEEQLKEAVEKQEAMRKLVLGDYLIEQSFITEKQLNAALAYQQSNPNLRLGETFIQLGILTPKQLSDALARQRANRGRPLGKILVDMGVLAPETLKKFHAKKLGLPFVSLKNFKVNFETAHMVPSAVARRLGLIPIAVEDGSLIVASDSQLSTAALSEVSALAHNIRVAPVIALRAEIRAAQDACYGKETDAVPVMIQDPSMIRFESGDALDGQVDDQQLEVLFGKNESLDLSDEIHVDSERTLLLAIQHMLSAAVKSGTLEINIETEGTHRRTRIRYRK